MTEIIDGGQVLWRRLLPTLLVLLCLLAVIGTVGTMEGARGQQKSNAQQAANDWTQFGWDLASSGASTAPTGITAANVASLVRHQVSLDGTVDASAIYLARRHRERLARTMCFS